MAKLWSKDFCWGGIDVCHVFLSDPLDGKLLGQRSANATGVLQGITFAWALQYSPRIVAVPVPATKQLSFDPNFYYVLSFLKLFFILQPEAMWFFPCHAGQWWFFGAHNKSLVARWLGKGKPVAPLQVDGPNVWFFSWNPEKPLDHGFV